MKNIDKFDLNAFQSEVIEVARLFQEASKKDAVIVEDDISIPKAIYGEVEWVYTGEKGGVGVEPRYTKKQKRIDRTIKKAKTLTKRKDIKKIICPALQTASQDFIDIAKVITPALVGAGLAGTIIIPFNPLLFAVTALIIARVGIASFCADYSKDTKK